MESAMQELRQSCSNPDPFQLETLLSNPAYLRVALDREPEHKEKRPGSRNLSLLLLTAAELGNLGCVETILRFGHDHNVPYHTFISRWEITFKSGNDEILKQYVKSWPEVVSLHMGHCGYPLLQTLMKDKYNLSVYLLEHGADVNARCGPDNYPGSYIKLAAETLPLQYTILLIDHGAQVAQSGAIRMAAEKGRLDVLNLLIEHDGDINERLQPDAGFLVHKLRFQQASETPLYVATANRHHDVMTWLVEQGADAKIEALNRKTPEMLAMEIGDEESRRILGTRAEGGT